MYEERRYCKQCGASRLKDEVVASKAKLFGKDAEVYFCKDRNCKVLYNGRVEDRTLRITASDLRSHAFGGDYL